MSVNRPSSSDALVGAFLKVLITCFSNPHLIGEVHTPLRINLSYGMLENHILEILFVIKNVNG